VRRTPRLPLEALQPYLLATPAPASPTEPPPRLDWRTVFGNDHPVEMEVGFGKGLFLLTSALTRPEVNFVGVEIMRKYQLFTATRIAKRGLTNVRLACADARLFLRDHVQPDSLAALHVYFPDPWWKKRHQKRRLFTAEFVQEAYKVLKPGGLFSVATDVPEYFEVMVELLRQTPLVPETPEPGTAGQEPAVVTNFERKALDRGDAVHRMHLRKPGA
jgi:tRNA (guanine-N7-)-methyltransferase